MATYLVTGGCGFIGSHLADSLIAEGHHVRILDDLSSGKRENAPKGADVHIGDIRNPDAVREGLRGADGCFHLAAIASVARSNEEWVETHSVNLTGTITVFEAASKAKDGTPVPVVYASSAAVYGDSDDLPLSERTETRPLTAYGADKLGCELHARVAAVVHGVPSVGLRFFNVYGPRQDPASPYSGVISIFADRIVSARTVLIHGDGAQDRDFIYVSDCVAHVMAGMKLSAGGGVHSDVFNVCTGRSTSVLDLARILGEVAGFEPTVNHGPPRAGDIRRSLGDPTLSQQSLNVEAVVDIRDGLRRLVESMPRGQAA